MTVLTSMILVSIGMNLLAGAVPSKLANTRVLKFRRLVTSLVLVQLSIAVMTAGTILAVGTMGATGQVADPGKSLIAKVALIDGVSILMLTLVSFVGWIVCRYSERYLDGEAAQGQYFRWIAFTIGSVSTLVVSGNLLLFILAWMATSLGLHRLLLHYPERPAAQQAAWTKFAISRLGDVFLCSALILVWKEFGTFELTAIFDAVAAQSASSAYPAIIAWLLMLGAVTKSAQFPFHTWLPSTIETPTPVSALMHAGIVNAGGYLVIRMSPLVTQSSSAMTTLAVIGATTACFAGVVMLTQTSVKRTLAYSTMAQMGFMMLQCGLGAFSAAMLHILAHSLYKAHAFLSSGSVLSQANATRDVPINAKPSLWNAITVGVAAIVSVGVLATVGRLFGIDLASKPGGYALAFVLCLAMTTWTWRILSESMLLGRPTNLLRGMATLVALCLSYVVSYLAVDAAIASDVPPIAAGGMGGITVVLTIAVFAMLFVLHGLIVTKQRGQWLSAWYVHASNGFYIEAIASRMIRPGVST